jgi:hypothetical protein
MSIGRRVEYTITVNVAGYPEPTSPETIQVRAGEPFTQQLAASGGHPPYHWLPGTLPPGVTLTPEGVLSGTIAEPGTHTMSYFIADTLEAV